MGVTDPAGNISAPHYLNVYRYDKVNIDLDAWKRKPALRQKYFTRVNSFTENGIYLRDESQRSHSFRQDLFIAHH